MLPQMQNKVGATLALIGGVLALFAFFALPLFRLLFFQATASQVASGFGGIVKSSDAQLLWLGVVLPVIVAFLSLFLLARRVSFHVPVSPPNAQPSVPYGSPQYPVLSSPRTSYKELSLAIVVCSAINAVLLIVFYSSLSRDGSGIGSIFGNVTAASFLDTGFWIYMLAVIAMLAGGIIEWMLSPRD
jgi:hypothetical protein